jgi:hypothetical protein
MLLFLIFALILSWPLAPALALDPREVDLVPIRTVLADPQHYNLRSVRFHGTITGITILSRQGGCGNSDAYLLQFDDGTGNIAVLDEGLCLDFWRPVSPMLDLTSTKMGDRIYVTAIVMSPSNAPEVPIRAKLQGIGANTGLDPPRENLTKCRTFEECAEKPSQSSQ